MSALVVIPARYASVRFPGKPLAMLQGKPMIQHVYEGAARAQRAEEVIVATDDARIADAVRAFHGTAAMTDPQAASGTERVAEVARSRQAAIVVNVQGDEPLIHPEMVDQLVGYLERHSAVPMASLMTALRRPEDVASPNVVKVVTDRDGFALYFSRAPIPYIRHTQFSSGLRAQGSGHLPPAQSPQPRAFKHLGIYGYQRHFLLQFPQFEPTPLEQAEGLEQLRALEHGYRLKLLETSHDSVGVDTPEDLARVEARLAAELRERAVRREP